MENGEWRMENGEWGMENGEWRMGNNDSTFDIHVKFVENLNQVGIFVCIRKRQPSRKTTFIYNERIPPKEYNI
jgi:hypothetical protein